MFWLCYSELKRQWRKKLIKLLFKLKYVSKSIKLKKYDLKTKIKQLLFL